MKVYSIINEAIENAQQLSSSFTGEQWARIFAYFAHQNNLNFGDRRVLIKKRIKSLNDTIGYNMPPYINEFDWYRKARRFGLTQGLEAESSFEQIHQHLKQGAGFNLSQLDGWSNTEPELAAPRRNPDTPESLQQFIALIEAKEFNGVRSNAVEISDKPTLIAYMNHIQQIILENRDQDWQDKLNARGTSGAVPAIHQTLKNLARDKLVPSLDQNQKVPVAEVQKVMYMWLRRADMTFANPNYGQDQD